MKKFKQLSLIVAALFVIAFSFSSSKPFDTSKSFKSQTIECHFAVLADDDIDDDLVDDKDYFTYEFISDYSNRYQLTVGNPQPAPSSSHLSIPSYLKLRNLRI